MVQVAHYYDPSHLSHLTSQITVAALGPIEGHLDYNPLHANISLMVY